MSVEWQVTWSNSVDKQLAKLPDYLRDKFISWVMVVDRIGMLEARKLSGFHDEPLKGKRKGQRSVRLNRSYRAIYVEAENGDIIIVEVIEVTKHAY
jgi:proteic killer suppression protein